MSPLYQWLVAALLAKFRHGVARFTRGCFDGFDVVRQRTLDDLLDDAFGLVEGDHSTGLQGLADVFDFNSQANGLGRYQRDSRTVDVFHMEGYFGSIRYQVVQGFLQFSDVLDFHGTAFPSGGVNGLVS